MADSSFSVSCVWGVTARSVTVITGMPTATARRPPTLCQYARIACIHDTTESCGRKLETSRNRHELLDQGAKLLRSASALPPATPPSGCITESRLIVDSLRSTAAGRCGGVTCSTTGRGGYLRGLSSHVAHVTAVWGEGDTPPAGSRAGDYTLMSSSIYSQSH